MGLGFILNLLMSYRSVLFATKTTGPPELCTPSGA